MEMLLIGVKMRSKIKVNQHFFLLICQINHTFEQSCAISIGSKINTNENPKKD